MKRLFFSILFFFSLFKCKAQGTAVFPDASRVTFSLAIPTNINKEGKIMVSTKRHLITNVPDSLINEFAKWDNSVWIKLLQDERFSYVACMLLYQITLKDAFMFIAIKNQDDWRRVLKNDDVYYWMEFLKNRTLVKDKFVE